MKGTMKQIRKFNNKTQKQTAKELGLSETAYRNYENGESSPTISTVAKFCKIFNVEIADIFFNVELEKNESKKKITH